MTVKELANTVKIRGKINLDISGMTHKHEADHTYKNIKKLSAILDVVGGLEVLTIYGNDDGLTIVVKDIF